MNYKVIACTNSAYTGLFIYIESLHTGALTIIRNDGAQIIFQVDTILRSGKYVTLANSNFMAHLQEI